MLFFNVLDLEIKATEEPQTPKCREFRVFFMYIYI
jgi:hypothetical protein